MCKSEGNETVRNIFSLRASINDVNIVEKITQIQDCNIENRIGGRV